MGITSLVLMLDPQAKVFREPRENYNTSFPRTP